MLKKLLLILLLSVTTISFAVNVNMYDSLFNLILPVVIVLVTLILAILYAASDAFNNPQLKGWVKIELRELIASAILLLLVTGLMAGADATVQMFTGAGTIGENPLGYKEFALKQLDTYKQVFETPMYDIVEASHRLGVIGGYGYSQPIFLWFASWNIIMSPHSGIRPLQTAMSQAVTGISQGIFIYSGLRVLLSFFTSIVPYAILPLAFSLRFIPFTRRLGTTLIALCVGAAIIFPFSIIVVSAFHDSTMASDFNPVAITKLDMAPFKQLSLPALTAVCGADSDSVAGVIKSFVQINEIGWALLICIPVAAACTVGYLACFVACYELITMTVFPALTIIYQATVGISVYFSPMSKDYLDLGLIYDALKVFLQSINNHVVLAYVETIVIAIITIIGTKSLSITLGGEAYLMGLQRLI